MASVEAYLVSSKAGTANHALIMAPSAPPATVISKARWLRVASQNASDNAATVGTRMSETTLWLMSVPLTENAKANA